MTPMSDDGFWRAPHRRSVAAIVATALLTGTASHGASYDEPPAISQLQEVAISAPEPRYVAPTLRDRIGRIWAPVQINGQGPYRLVLDTGASRSGVIAQVATALRLPLDGAHQVLLRGVTGARAVPVARASNFDVGDLSFGSVDLPIITDPLGGADGILGIDGMSQRRIAIDFRHDRIQIARSHGETAPTGYMTIPFTLLHGRVPVVDARIGRIHVRAIIDTGAQATIGNLALRDALLARHSAHDDRAEQVQGVTDDIQDGISDAVPAVRIDAINGGLIAIPSDRMVFGDMQLFNQWHLTNEPVMLLGMDEIGTLDNLIIDFRRHELQLLTRRDF